MTNVEAVRQVQTIFLAAAAIQVGQRAHTFGEAVAEKLFSNESDKERCDER
jgi:hypothetical protein